MADVVAASRSKMLNLWRRDVATSLLSEDPNVQCSSFSFLSFGSITKRQYGFFDLFSL